MQSHICSALGHRIEAFIEMMGVIVAIGGLLALMRDGIGTMIVVR